MTKRYYFHGDQIENKDEQYFCAYCDLFVDELHFEKYEHSGSNKERYDRSVKGWKILNDNHPGCYSRPNKAINLFSHIPKPPKPKKSTFYRWLIKQKDRDDPIGDLSVDVQRDPTFPLNTNSLTLLQGYLVHKFFVSQDCKQALVEAHAEFKTKKRVRSGLSLSLRFDIFRRDDYRCQICGNTSNDGVKLEVDHKIPVVNGGSDDESNLWTLCFDCNRGKSAKNL